MKKLLLLIFVSAGIMHASQEFKPDRDSFRNHINEAKAIRSSILDHLYNPHSAPIFREF